MFISSLKLSRCKLLLKSLLLICFWILLITIFAPISTAADPVKEITTGTVTGGACSWTNLSCWPALFIGSVLALVISVIGYLITGLTGLLIWIGSYNGFINAEAVKLGWSVVRDISNMFFVLVLLIISFGTILHVQQYQMKSLLPKVIVMAILVNFSKAIAGLFIDFAQVIMLTFVAAYSTAGAGNFLSALNIEELLTITPASEVTTLGIAGAYIFATLLSIVALVVIIAMLLIFIVRIVMLWLLIVFSPLAYVLSVVPAGQKYAQQWWDMFSKYVIIGPVLAFFLWLSLATLPSIGTQQELNPNNPQNKANIEESAGQKIPNLTSVGISAGEADKMVGYLISISMLIMSLIFAQEVGGAVGKIAGNAYGKIASGGAWLAKSPLKGLAYLNELQAARSNITLNPRHWVEAFRESREFRRDQRLRTAKGTARDITQLGIRRAAGTMLRGTLGTEALEERLKIAQREKEERERLLSGASVVEEYKKSRRANIQQLREEAFGQDTIINEKKDRQSAVRNELERRTAVAASPETQQLEGELAEIREKRARTLSGTVMKELDEKAEKIEKKLSEVRLQMVSPTLRNEDEQLSKEITELSEGRNRRLADAEKDEQEFNELETNPSRLFGEAVEVENKRARAADNQIAAIRGGHLSDTETHRLLNEVKAAINRRDRSIRENREGGFDVTEDEQQLERLKRRENDLKIYQQALQEGQSVGELGLNDISNIQRSNVENLAALMSDGEYNSRVENLQNEAAHHRFRAENTAPLSSEQEETFREEIEERKAEMKQLQETIARRKLPKGFYADRARRELIDQEYRKISTENAQELVQYLQDAVRRGDKITAAAISHKLAYTANDNEFLNAFGKSSGFRGYKEFFEDVFGKQLKMKREEMLALASDISFVNESKNHWNTARTVTVDPVTGERRWMNDMEHLTEALAEIRKLDQRRIVHDFNRLPFGGERPVPGGREFEMEPLGYAMLNMITKSGTLRRFADRNEVQPNQTSVLIKALERLGDRLTTTQREALRLYQTVNPGKSLEEDAMEAMRASRGGT